MDIIKNTKDVKIAIIGAGASGISCAVELKRLNRKYDITIFEHLEKPLKKILATGNGRCNFCNTDLSFSHYHGSREIINSILNCKYSDTVSFFRSLGVLSSTESTRIYPRSFTASSVRDALLNNVKSKLITSYNINNIKKIDSGYIIDGDYFDIVVFACGGICAGSHGSDGSVYKFIENCGHSFTRLKPSLTALTSPDKDLKLLKGIRANGTVSLIQNGKRTAVQDGEIQFTEKTVSGIPVFDLSYLYDENANNELCIDFCSELSKEYIRSFLKSFITDITTEDALSGLIPKKLGYTVINRSGIPQGLSVFKLTDKSIDSLCTNLKELRFKINGTRDFNNSQVTAGGINSNEIYPQTLMSRLNKNMFFCGEILDVNGDCGGYNLHFAFTSGRLVAHSIENL